MTYRCFIAINLPNDIKSKLNLLLRELKSKNSSRFITYVKPENIHITLQFLGNIDVGKLTEIKEALNEVSQHYGAFHLEFDGFEAFPNFQNPRVLYIGAKGDTDAAKKIQKNLGDRLFDLGFITDAREWVSHLTLARIKSPMRLDLDIKIPKAQFQVTSLELMRSELTPHGPRYSILESC